MEETKMDANKHTPGPWKAAEMGVIADTITSHGNFYVCSLIEPDNPEDQANAQLIAKAWLLPEVEQCLLQVKAWLQSGFMFIGPNGEESPRNPVKWIDHTLAKLQQKD